MKKVTKKSSAAISNFFNLHKCKVQMDELLCRFPFSLNIHFDFIVID